MMQKPMTIAMQTTAAVRQCLRDACRGALAYGLPPVQEMCVMGLLARLRGIEGASASPDEVFTATLDLFADPVVQAQMPCVWAALDDAGPVHLASSNKAQFIAWSYMVGIQRLDRDELLKAEIRNLNRVLGDEANDMESMKMVCHWAGVECSGGTFATVDDLKINLLKAGVPVFEVEMSLSNIFPPSPPFTQALAY